MSLKGKTIFVDPSKGNCAVKTFYQESTTALADEEANIIAFKQYFA